jgi:hypothetical protein
MDALWQAGSNRSLSMLAKVLQAQYELSSAPESLPLGFDGEVTKLRRVRA